MDLQVERQMLSPGVGAAGRVGEGGCGPVAGHPLPASHPLQQGRGKGHLPSTSPQAHACVCSVCALSFLGSCPTPVLGSGPTLLSRALISCWLAVDRRKLLICPFSGSSTSTSMS